MISTHNVSTPFQVCDADLFTTLPLSLSWAWNCGHTMHGTENGMLVLLLSDYKKLFFNLIILGQILRYDPPNKCLTIVYGVNLAEICFSHCRS